MSRLSYWLCVPILAGCSATPPSSSYQPCGEPARYNHVSKVAGTSMAPTIPEGSMISIQPIDYAELKDAMIVSWLPEQTAHNLKRVRLGQPVTLTADNPALHVRYTLLPHQLDGFVSSYVTPDGALWKWDGTSGYRRVE